MPVRFPAPEEPETEREDLTSRSDLKRANRVVEEALERLTTDLCRLSEKKLLLLGLSESVRDAILECRAIESPRAKQRQLRLVRSELRDSDWSSIQKRLLLLVAHGSVPVSTEESPAEASAEASWVTRLLGEGALGLEAFIRQYPRADRTHLRQLVRATERASGDRRNKAERKLRDAVRGFLPRAERRGHGAPTQ
jgi:ribosome-associated protein